MSDPIVDVPSTDVVGVPDKRGELDAVPSAPVVTWSDIEDAEEPAVVEEPKK